MFCYANITLMTLFGSSRLNKMIERFLVILILNIVEISLHLKSEKKWASISWCTCINIWPTFCISFYTPHQKIVNQRRSGVFTGYRKVSVVWNGLMKTLTDSKTMIYLNIFTKLIYETYVWNLFCYLRYCIFFF